MSLTLVQSFLQRVPETRKIQLHSWACYRSYNGSLWKLIALNVPQQTGKHLPFAKNVRGRVAANGVRLESRGLVLQQPDQGQGCGLLFAHRGVLFLYSGTFTCKGQELPQGQGVSQKTCKYACMCARVRVCGLGGQG